MPVMVGPNAKSRSILIWITATLCLWLMGSAEFGWAQTTPRTTVASNIRQGPGLEHAVLRVVPGSTELVVTGRNVEGTWLQLEDGAWIFAELVTPLPTHLPVVDSGTVIPSTPDTVVTEPPHSHALRQMHLQEINSLRAGHGLRPLVLVEAGPAQKHAVELATGAYISHWDRNGLAPYMRYTRDVGEGTAQENIHQAIFFRDGCIPADYDYQSWLTKALAELANSPGHRATLMQEYATEVRIGLAQSCHSLVLVQVVGHRYLRWTQTPRLENEVLRFEGEIHIPARMGSNTQVLIAWEPLPQSSSVDQLAQTGCYSLPRRILLGVRQAGSDEDAEVTASRCYSLMEADPTYLIPSDPAQARQERTHFINRSPRRETYTLPMHRARKWEVGIRNFTMEFDLREILRTRGDGIYTVSVWGRAGTVWTVLGQYALVVGDRSDLW